MHGTISEPITTTSYKPGTEGKTVTIRLVEEGAGLLGLHDINDSKEWSGIFNHVLLSARYSTHLAQQLRQRGNFVNPQRVLDGMLSSHNGRRQWDEARWYPEAATNAEEKMAVSNETLGIQLIEGKIPRNAYDLVVALGHNVEGLSVDPHIFETLDYKVAIYADHRTSQSYESLYERMGEFLLANFFDRNKVNQALRSNVYEGMQAIIELRRSATLGRYPGEISLDAADQIAEELGASPVSSRIARRELMQLVLQDADTEAMLLHNDIPIDDVEVPMPQWEHELRKHYVLAAKDDIVTLFQLNGPIEDTTSWCERYARKLYEDKSNS